MPLPGESPIPMSQPPAQPQAEAGAAASGQPPIGSSPATQPVPNRGLQAAGLAKLQVIVRQLEALLPTFGAGSDVGKDVLKALSGLSKHIQPGSVSPGVEQSALQEILMKSRQNALQMAAAKGMGQGGQPPQPGMPGAGGGAPAIPPQLLAMLAKPQGAA